MLDILYLPGKHASNGTIFFYNTECPDITIMTSKKWKSYSITAVCYNSPIIIAKLHNDGQKLTKFDF